MDDVPRLFRLVAGYTIQQFGKCFKVVIEFGWFPLIECMALFTVCWRIAMDNILRQFFLVAGHAIISLGQHDHIMIEFSRFPLIECMTLSTVFGEIAMFIILLFFMAGRAYFSFRFLDQTMRKALAKKVQHFWFTLFPRFLQSNFFQLISIVETPIDNHAGVIRMALYTIAVAQFMMEGARGFLGFFIQLVALGIKQADFGKLMTFYAFSL